MLQPELFSLMGRYALITGAAGHLGKPISIALAKAGAHVILLGRNREKLYELKEHIESFSERATVCSIDLFNFETEKVALHKILDTFPKLDILINNAYSGQPKAFEEGTSQDFQSAYQVTVTVAHQLLQLCLPYLKKSQHASVINIASMYASVSPDPAIYGDSGFNNPPYYGAAKSGLLQLTRYYGVHLASENIRVNAISPGPFPPQSIHQQYSDFAQKLVAKVPLQRIGRAEELCGPVLFLASDASSFVTGANLPVDGGWTAW